MITVHRSCNRVSDFLGGDREIVMSAMVIAATLILLVPNAVSVSFGLSLWFFALFATRLMRKSDPLMKETYLRYIRYAPYYSAKTSAFVYEPETAKEKALALLRKSRSRKGALNVSLREGSGND